ncbi:MAG: PQQ-dependent sugar dehydrogenase, partial [Bacteroidota bacterium]
MLKYFSALLILSMLIHPSIKSQDGASLYKTYCSGCHGANMEGGIATALVKDDWKYGKSRSLITRNIRYGIPGTEMIGWKDALGNAGVKSIVEYIMQAQKSAPTSKRNFPKSLQSQDYELSVEVIGKGKIETPWGIEFIHKDLALISEQKGQLRWLRNGKLDPKPITGLPEVHIFTGTLGGLMDIALDPNYADNGWVYLAFSQTDGKVGDRTSAAMTKIIRGKIKDYQWTETQELFSAPKNIRVRMATRWGGRMLFDKEGYLFFSIGDLDFGEDCQDLSRANG